MKLIKKEAYTRMPWKNGLGTTAEILKSPEDCATYDWRLSQATVGADGAFSIFPDMHRCLIVFKGSGLLLNQLPLLPLKPLTFSGEEKIYATLIKDSVEDLGVIYNPHKFNVEMRILLSQELQKLQINDQNDHFFYILSGSLLINNQKAEIFDTLFFSKTEQATIDFVSEDFEAILGIISPQK